MTRTGHDTQDLTDAGVAQPPVAAEPAPTKRVRAHRDPKRRTRFSLFSVFRKGWVLFVILVVVAIAGFIVFRLHGVFGKTETTRPGSGLANDTKPFNPKRVLYEIYGPPGTVATINYLDLQAQPQSVKDVTLPWSLLLTTTAPAASANIIAQGDSDWIGCRVTVNDEVKDENTTHGVNAQTFCWVKSA
jgi:hypothetical protein